MVRVLPSTSNSSHSLSSWSVSELVDGLSRLLSTHIFALALNLGVLVLVGWFSGTWVSFLAYFAFFFLPGYLVGDLLFSNTALRSLFSIPLSFVLISLFLFFADLVSPYIISPLVFGLFLSLVFLGWFFLRRKWKVDWSLHFDWPSSGFNSVLLLALLLVALLAGFGAYIQYAGKGSLDNSYPVAVFGWDKVIQLTWIHAMAETGSTFLPGSLHNGNSSAESSYLTPGSIFPTGMFVRLSGLSYWDAQTLFSAIIFMGIVAGIFVLMSYFFTWRVGIVATLLGAFPYFTFYLLDVAGALRVQLGILLIVFLLVLLDLCRVRAKGAFALSGIFLGAFVCIHFVSLVALVIPLGFLAISLAKQHNREAFVHFFLLGWLPLVVLFFYLPVAPVEYVEGLLSNAFELFSPFHFEQLQASTVGPIMILLDYWSTLLLGLIGGGLVFIEWFHSRKKSPETSVSDKKYFSFLLSFLFLFLLSLGVSSLFFHYSGKLRSAFYILFLLPLMGYLFLRVADSKIVTRFIPKDWHRLVGVLLVVFVLVHPWALVPNQSVEKVDATSWNVMQWVDTHASPSSHVLALTGFYQFSYLLANRPGNYLGRKPVFLNYVNGVPHRFTEYCIPGYVRSGIVSIAQVPCSDEISRLNQYDYLLADYLAVNHLEQVLGRIEQSLEQEGFTPVYSYKEITVYQNTRLLH